MRKITIKYIPSLREQQNKEVYQKLKTLCMNNYQEQCSARYIGLKNGIYDTVEEKLKAFSHQYYITNIIDVDFNEQAQSDLIERFIKDISNDDEEVEQLIYEMIGYGLYRDNFLQVAFFTIVLVATVKLLCLNYCTTFIIQRIQQHYLLMT